MVLNNTGTTFAQHDRSSFTEGSCRFQFITIDGSATSPSYATKRLVKSHAVKRALEIKRKLQQDAGDNFRTSTPQNKPKRIVLAAAKHSQGKNACSERFYPLSAGLMDPFRSLAVDSRRLQALLGHVKARQAPEPVFSISEQLSFQNFRTVFRTGWGDPALLNAAMLTFVLATTEGSINQECLSYQSQAISHIRERMGRLDEAASESTIGAILLLAGVEARLGVTSKVQLHMNAVQQLLEICKKRGISLTQGIKRAVFWQDLHSSILSGSSRIVGLDTFKELHWARNPLPASVFRLPKGFARISENSFPQDLIVVLEDIHALHHLRDSDTPIIGNVDLAYCLNNQIASIQSRLITMENLEPAVECCRLAAFMCSVMLCCTVWCGLVVPPHITAQLLDGLQRSSNDPVWDDHPELLVWLLFVGGAFAPRGTLRSEFIVLVQLNHPTRFRGLYGSWVELRELLREFTWSRKAFEVPVEEFWKATVPNDLHG